MTLQQELRLKKPFETLEHEAVLNIYHTASCIKKTASEFFSQYGLTDVQFNVLALLHYQSTPGDGLTQAQLSEMMLVNRANITSLIDRMEKAELVCRTDDKTDRRANIIISTEKGQKLFAQVQPLYQEKIRQTMSTLSLENTKQLISTLESIRKNL